MSQRSFRSKGDSGVFAENLNLLRVPDDVSRGKGVFPKADCASIENKRGSDRGEGGGVAHVLRFSPCIRRSVRSMPSAR